MLPCRRRRLTAHKYRWTTHERNLSVQGDTQAISAHCVAASYDVPGSAQCAAPNQSVDAFRYARCARRFPLPQHHAMLNGTRGPHIALHKKTVPMGSPRANEDIHSSVCNEKVALRSTMSSKVSNLSSFTTWNFDTGQCPDTRLKQGRGGET